MQPTETTQLSEPAIESIIAELDVEYTGKLPVEAIRALRARREEAVPHLIELIRVAARSSREDGEDGRRLAEGPFLALYLLAEFRAIEALPAIVEALSLPGDGAYTLFGDAITEALSGMLAALAVDSREVVEQLIVNREIDEFVRGAAARTYLCWVRDGVMTRKDAVERLRGHLRTVITDEDHDYAGILVCELVDYAEPDSLHEIREAFRLNLVDSFLINLEDAEECIARGDAEFQYQLDYCRATGVADTIEELSRWHAYSREIETRFPRGAVSQPSDIDPFEFDEPWGPIEPLHNTAPKVGRNEPCPCGSGRKFKKCCGAV